jgi:hypothetical protein
MRSYAWGLREKYAFVFETLDSAQNAVKLLEASTGPKRISGIGTQWGHTNHEIQIRDQTKGSKRQMSGPRLALFQPDDCVGRHPTASHLMIGQRVGEQGRALDMDQRVSNIGDTRVGTPIEDEKIPTEVGGKEV